MLPACRRLGTCYWILLEGQAPLVNSIAITDGAITEAEEPTAALYIQSLNK